MYQIPPRFLATIAIACALLFTLVACSDGNDSMVTTMLGIPGTATDPAPPAELSGPLDGEPILVSSFFPLASVGYEQAEFFASGTASSYINVNELQPDGRWEVQVDQTADYRTRLVVIRPSDPADFNGTVVVEWLNVSAGFDAAPDWGMLHTEFIRSGYAWVGLSAQQAGVEALLDGSAAAVIPGAISDDRYTTLSHPGDEFAYDILSQVGQALKGAGPANPFGSLSPQRFIAAGESQSAAALMTYINALAPRHAVFDGYFVHSRVAGSLPLKGDIFTPDQAVVPTPDQVQVRADLGVPTMMLQTETDLFILGSYDSNQEDSDMFRMWEVAGSAHADLYTFLDNRVDVGTDPSVAAIREVIAPIPGIIECEVPVNAGPQHWVAKAAIVALNRWVEEGTPPPTAERLDVAGSPPAFVVDELGNVRGGVRTPYVDVPIAVLSGEGQPQIPFDTEDRDFCFLSGTTELFDVATLASLYESNQAYISALNASADDSVAKGFLLEADAQLIKDHAASSDIFAP
ncbi:MAG: alpha/beta hydrolase domain-containing protein [Pseudomonadota bacterium]